MLAMLLAGVVLLLVSVFAPAPLAQPIGETASFIGTARAPWFFLWVQEMLKLGDPFLFGILTPILLLLFLSALPYLSPRLSDSELGKWFPRSNRGIQIIALLVTLAVVIFSILALIPNP